jgi:PIN domain nuclease of toxin-antitoxin system
LRLLLDTHVWIWIAFRDTRLSARTLRAIQRAAAAGDLLVSPISAWEIGLLHGRRRLRLEKPVDAWVEEALAMPGLNVAALSPQIAVASWLLPGPLHADPADRILIATAREADAKLVTADEEILAYAKLGHVAILD